MASARTPLCSWLVALIMMAWAGAAPAAPMPGKAIPDRRPASQARASAGDTVVVLSTQSCIGSAGPGAWTTCTHLFSATPAAGHKFVLVLDNGLADGSNRVSAVSARINSREWIGSAEITRTTASFARTVELVPSDTLEVSVQGAVGSHVSYHVAQVPDPSFRAYGLQTFTRASGAPQPELRTFTLSAEAGAPFTLVVSNGAPNGSGRVSSAEITLDGTRVVTHGDLQQGVAMLERTVGAQPGDSLEVRVAGDPGSSLTLEVRATDVAPPSLAVTAPLENATLYTGSVDVTGIVTDAHPFTLTVNGQSAAVAMNGSFGHPVALVMGANVITVVATDMLGQAVTVIRNVTREPAPIPPPVVQGTSLTSITPFRDAYAYLFRSPGGVQFDADSTLFDPRGAAVLRGVVRRVDGTVLPNVDVKVNGVEDLGWTRTRLDGAWDLMVAGGGPLTVSFTKDGMIPVQRRIETPWRDVRVLEDVIMTAYDPAVTALAFTDTIEVARASPVTDADGTRRATLMFEQGTTATLVMPNGSTAPLGSVSVRATELTVGINGPQAMPAALPATSAYTYCVELSVDEAIEAGAVRVNFSKPVAFYVENFLQNTVTPVGERIPVGKRIPMGFYDRVRGVWVPEADGRVIEIVGRDSSMVLLDLDGDGNADTHAAMLAIGIDAQERAELARLYVDDTQLWRFETTHFSPGDANTAMAFEAGAIAPALDFIKKLLESLNCQTPAYASVIECESRVLGESIPITGTPYQLVYRSSRAPGFRAARKVSIPVIGETVPSPEAFRVRVVVHVAGTVHEFAINPPYTANQRFDFTWNGLDAQGRVVRGSVTATVDVEWIYRAFMAAGGDATTQASFGLPPRGPGFEVFTRGLNQGVFRVRQKVALGTFDMTQAGLGGWSVDVHHVYDMNASGTLYRGDGERVSGERMRPRVNIIRTSAVSQVRISDVAVGRDGSIYYRLGNLIKRIRPTGQELQVYHDQNNDLFGGFHMAVADSDSILIVCRERHRVYALKGGTLRPFLGNGDQGSPIDGAVAVNTPVNEPDGVAIGADGAVYVSDYSAHAVYRVAPNGRVYIYAGTPGVAWVSGPVGDGGLAFNALLKNPRGLAFGPDGSLYIADSGTWRMRRVTPDGVITTVAGTGSGLSDGDGGPAVGAAIGDVSDVAFTPDGGYYLMATNGLRIRRVSPDGFISPVIGNGEPGNAGLDGGPAGAAQINAPTRIALDQEGQLWIANASPSSQLLRVRQVLPGFSSGEVLVASRDGGELYVFDAAGRHLRTLDGLTGAVRYRFGYNAAGQLSSIADPANLTTTIERDGANPTAMVGPFGHRTTFQTDGNGFLTRVTDPRGAYFQLTPSAQGMLTRFEDPNRHGNDFTYDADSLLIEDADAAGGSQTLAGGVMLDSLVQVTRTTEEGRITTYDVVDRRVGDLVRKVTDPANLATTSIETPAGLIATNTPEGTYRRALVNRDQRLGMEAPILDSLTVSTGNKVLGIDGQRSYPNAQLATPLDYGRRLDEVTVNGRTWRSAFDRVPQLLTVESPQNRFTFTTVDSVGRPLRVRVAGLDSLVLGYDAQGRVITVTQGPRQWSYAYEDSGRLETITDPMERVTTLRYDAADRVIRQELPGGIAVSLDYDDASNLTAVKPPGKPIHSFTHTPVDLVQSYVPPSVPGGGSTAYGYDVDRALDTITRPGGEVVDLDHDGAGRLQQVTHAHDRVVVGYHPTTGLLTSAASDSGASLGYGYAGALPQSETWTFPSVGAVSVSVDYDDDFRVILQTVAGDTAGFSYDKDGLLVRAGPQRMVRDSLNGLLARTEVGVLITEFGYNGAGEVIALQTRTSGGQVLYQEGLTRDLLGRVETRTDSVWTGSAFDIRTEVYHYDAAGRLETVTRNGNLIATYGYDDNGNRTSFTGPAPAAPISAAYDDQDRLLSYGSITYGYTANGELASRTDGADITQYQYDALGALRRVKLPGGATVEYGIDAQGRRVARGDPGSPSRFWVYQNGLNIVAELDGAGALTKRFVYGSRGHAPDLMRDGVNVYRLVTDHLGSMVLVANIATGTIAGRKRYDAWGVPEEDTAPGLVPFGFAGGLTDESTALVRFGARDYDPFVGRWTAKDPVGFVDRQLWAHTWDPIEGGLLPVVQHNLFVYADCDPVTFVDVSGLAKKGKRGLSGDDALLQELEAIWESYSKGELSRDEATRRSEALAAKIGSRRQAREFRALLKVLRRGGTMCLVFGVLFELITEPAEANPPELDVPPGSPVPDPNPSERVPRPFHMVPRPWVPF